MFYGKPIYAISCYSNQFTIFVSAQSKNFVFNWKVSLGVKCNSPTPHISHSHLENAKYFTHSLKRICITYIRLPISTLWTFHSKCTIHYFGFYVYSQYAIVPLAYMFYINATCAHNIQLSMKRRKLK